MSGHEQAILLIGFDSAWTAHNKGGIVSVLLRLDVPPQELNEPARVNFSSAEDYLVELQQTHRPTTTYVLLDQPTIVANHTGQRPVENLVASPVSLRFGGVSPANRQRKEMFGDDAPVWKFLAGRNLSPYERHSVNIFETYPVLAIIAFDWLLYDSDAKGRKTGRLPKYNPQRRKTFLLSDWKFLCRRVAERLEAEKLFQLAGWVRDVGQTHPNKAGQDKLDACICLLIGMHWLQMRPSLMVGSLEEGYILVPDSDVLRGELSSRCVATGRDIGEWVMPLSYVAGGNEEAAAKANT